MRNDKVLTDSALVERLLSGRHPLATEAAGEIMRLEAENARLRKYTILNEPSAPDSAVPDLTDPNVIRALYGTPFAPDSAVSEDDLTTFLICQNPGEVPTRLIAQALLSKFNINYKD